MTILQMPAAARQQRHREFTAAIRESGLDPNVADRQICDLLTDSESAVARGAVAVPDEHEDGETAVTGLPPRMVEEVLRAVRTWLGPDRGERLVVALNDYVATQPGLARILSTPGLMARPAFKPVLEAMVEHVHKTNHI